MQLTTTFDMMIETARADIRTTRGAERVADHHRNLYEETNIEIVADVDNEMSGERDTTGGIGLTTGMKAVIADTQENNQ